MNANIFDNNEDVDPESEPEDSPTVFQDFENPLQAAIAIAYFRHKKQPEKHEKLVQILKGCEQHARVLGKIQQNKIEELTKMLVDVTFSKL